MISAYDSKFEKLLHGIIAGPCCVIISPKEIIRMGAKISMPNASSIAIPWFIVTPLQIYDLVPILAQEFIDGNTEGSRTRKPQIRA